MSVSVTKTIDAVTAWGNASAYFGGVRGNYTITATINDEMTQLSMNIRCNSLEIDDSQGSGHRYNCWFLTALIDPRANTPFVDRLGGPDAGGYSSWSDIQNEIAQSSFNTSWGNIANNCICAIGVAENSGGGHYHAGLTVGSSVTLTKPLSASDFDADGNYTGSAILIISNRFWNSGDVPITGNDVDGEPIGNADFMIQTSSFSVGFDDFRFFPGKIKKGSEWKSHNRYYSPSNQGHASILKDGSWRDILNTINPRAATVNKGIIKSNGQWVTQALIGVDKDTR